MAWVTIKYLTGGAVCAPWLKDSKSKADKKMARGPGAQANGASGSASSSLKPKVPNPMIHSGPGENYSAIAKHRSGGGGGTH
jgi:hypothetical protein